jgi:uncharacterized protein YhbP (UPF0306 family)
MPPHEIDIKREALTLLAHCRTASLATVDADGNPHAANIQFAYDDDLNLYYVSSPDAAHSRHIALASNPAVAVTVYDHHDSEPALIHGLQLHAHATAVTDAVERGRVLTLYTARFPFITTDPKLAAAVERQNFYKLTPTWLRLIDNRRGFGWKAEMQLD